MADQYPLCPMCEAGELEMITYCDTFQHHGSELVVSGLEGYQCPTCGSDPVFEDQIRRNHSRIVDARRRVDGLLTGTEIRALRERLHLTQKDASERFGGGANAFSKYERGDVVQSVAMDRLLRLVARHPVLLSELTIHLDAAPAFDEGPCEQTAANDHNGYIDGNLVRMHGRGYRTPACGADTVVQLSEWTSKRSRAA
jgi:HTH-type transcriptional regulator / antitoxin MqsA